MSDPIISKLLRNHKKILFESMSPINEAEADEEYLELNDSDDEEEEHDDSQAPIQGDPDDYDEPEESDSEDIDSDTESSESEETEDSEESLPDEPSAPSSGGSSAPMSAPEGAPEEEMPEEEIDIEDKTAAPEEYENPLDNEYAVHYTLGDEVNLTAKGVQNADVKKGTIEGYDPEGFYKVRWSDDSTTSGLTDIALESLISTKKESVCVCGSEELVLEGKYIICDCCGRKIRESKEDPLMLADKSRPKGKRMIRSEAHPVSTATKPNISMAEAIRKALKGDKSLNEDEETEIEQDTFDDLKKLDNEFWTRKNELSEDIEELGYTVEEINDEYVVVSSDDDEDNAYLIPLGGTSRSFTLDFSKARMI